MLYHLQIINKKDGLRKWFFLIPTTDECMFLRDRQAQSLVESAKINTKDICKYAFFRFRTKASYRKGDV